MKNVPLKEQLPPAHTHSVQGVDTVAITTDVAMVSRVISENEFPCVIRKKV
jgi:hypothetical protein